MDKIYSRNRLCLPKWKGMNNRSNIPNRRENKLHRWFVLCVIIVIAFFTASTIAKSISPIVEKLCEDKAKNIATIISNEQATLVMKNYQYEDLITITKDSNGNVTMIKANVIPINEIISDVPVKILEEYKKVEKNSFGIPLGSFTGIRMLSGFGPEVTIKIANVGNVETNLKSEFTAQGINQTLHRIYLEVKCEVSMLTPYKTIDQSIVNQVLLAESVIVGTVPNTYYNLEGLTKSDTVNLID